MKGGVAVAIEVVRDLAGRRPGMQTWPSSSFGDGRPS